MAKYTVSAQLYTLRDFLKTPDDIVKTMKRVKKNRLRRRADFRCRPYRSH